VETEFAMLAETAPSLRNKRFLSTALSWSRATWPDFPWKRAITLVGYGRVAVVMGATIIVSKYSFISSGEITRQGRVFWISAPWVGSRVTSQTSSRRGGPLTISIPYDQTRWV
jgi:hypothetical protein